MYSTKVEAPLKSTNKGEVVQSALKMRTSCLCAKPALYSALVFFPKDLRQCGGCQTIHSPCFIPLCLNVWMSMSSTSQLNCISLTALKPTVIKHAGQSLNTTQYCLFSPETTWKDQFSTAWMHVCAIMSDFPTTWLLSSAFLQIKSNLLFLVCVSFFFLTFLSFRLRFINNMFLWLTSVHQ